MNKAAQISQVFIYIMAVIIFATILIFGYKAINNFINKGDEFAFVTFKTDLEKAVVGISSDFDSVIVYNANNPFRVPTVHNKICFIDVDALPVSNCIEKLGVIACDAWKTYSDDPRTDEDSDNFDVWEIAESNVFLDPPGRLPIKIGKVRFDNPDGYLCFDVNGRLDFKLTGKGRYTLVSGLS